MTKQQLEQRLTEAHRLVGKALGPSLDAAKEAGICVLEAQRLFPDGWAEWCLEKCGVRRRTAYYYLDIARFWAKIESYRAEHPGELETMRDVLGAISKWKAEDRRLGGKAARKPRSMAPARGPHAKGGPAVAGKGRPLSDGDFEAVVEEATQDVQAALHEAGSDMTADEFLGILGQLAAECAAVRTVLGCLV